MIAADTVELSRPPDDLRNGVRQALTAAPEFGQLDADDRRTIAQSLVRIAHAARLLEREAGEPARVPFSRSMNAGDEYSGAAVDRMAGTTRQMLKAISFPRFVSELIIGVFGAIVQTNQQQLEQYVQLVRGVSQSLEGFSSLGGNDDAARRWLAEQFPQSYEIEEPDSEDQPAPDEEPEPLQLRPVGAPPSADALRSALGVEAGTDIPTGGTNELVRFVRSSLARNRQQMLATMIQMGMQRIVIDSGRINAAMRFHIDAKSAAEEARGSKFDTRTTASMKASGGIGIWTAAASVSSTIGYVSTTDVNTREETTASADVNSSVELHFRTDQVPLDRIASQQTVDRLRLNTLNPERELDIARQADEARMANQRQIETARASRPRLESAPPLSAPALDTPAARPPATPTTPPPTTPPPSGTTPSGTPPTGTSPTGTTPTGTTPTATTPVGAAPTGSRPAVAPPSATTPTGTTPTGTTPTATPRPPITPPATTPPPAR